MNNPASLINKTVKMYKPYLNVNVQFKIYFNKKNCFVT